MSNTLQNPLGCRPAVLSAVTASLFAISALAVEPLPPERQTSLVRKYCAVCHTDAAKNGGLSLEHYNAAQPNPALAAMLLSKLRTGAMGAAGLGHPDAATSEAWIATTAAQAERAQDWTVARTEVSGTNAAVVTASIVREVAPRPPRTDVPLYRLTLTCNLTTRQGEVQLTWSPEPQTNRTFSVSVDGTPEIPHRLQGREEKMGNGTALPTGLASVMLTMPLPERTLTIADLFPGETVVFPIGELTRSDWQQLAVCLDPRARQ